MPAKSKYKKKFTAQLSSGMRSDGFTIEEVCQAWDISPTCYHNWKKEYPEFLEAHEKGERDYKAWWAKRYRNIATGVEPGNAAMMNLVAKNYLGMVDKQEIDHNHSEQITTIRIERIESPKSRIIEHDSRAENLLDKQPG